jgi:hypothetical protein
VLNENIFLKEMIYEKRLGFGRKNVICENDMKLCMTACKGPTVR